MVLICIFLMANEVEHLFMCLVIFIYLLWWRMCSNILPIFFFCPFLSWIVHFLIFELWDFFIYSARKFFIRYIIYSISSCMWFVSHSLFIYIYKFIYLRLCWVFVAVHGLSLVVASRGYSSLRCGGFSLWWLLLLWSTGSRHVGFSCCGTWAQ